VAAAGRVVESPDLAGDLPGRGGSSGMSLRPNTVLPLSNRDQKDRDRTPLEEGASYCTSIGIVSL
jgi:hypothetical protein